MFLADFDRENGDLAELVLTLLGLDVRAGNWFYFSLYLTHKEAERHADRGLSSTGPLPKASPDCDQS